MPWVNTGWVADLHIFWVTFKMNAAAKSLMNGSTIMKKSVFEDKIIPFKSFCMTSKSVCVGSFFSLLDIYWYFAYGLVIVYVTLKT